MTNESPDVRAVFTGSVTERGQLLLDEPAVVMARLLRMFKGKRVDVIVMREKKQRSDAQNRYYWSMVVPVFSEATGYEKEEAHEILKALFLRQEIALPGGELVERVGSSAELDTAAFHEYVEKCCRWLSGHGWYVPQPGEKVEAIA